MAGDDSMAIGVVALLEAVAALRSTSGPPGAVQTVLPTSGATGLDTTIGGAATLITATAPHNVAAAELVGGAERWAPEGE